MTQQVIVHAYCFTCLKAKGLGMLKACASKGDEAFLARGYTNWKDVRK